MAKHVKVDFVENSEIKTPEDIGEVMAEALNEYNLRGTNQRIYYYNVPCAFDIETTSFYRQGNVQYNYDDVQEILNTRPKEKFEKCAIMYVWQLGINGRVIMGRTWGEFTQAMQILADTLQLSKDKRLIIYVHNLAYEFQFIRTLFEWERVFSIDERKPIYAITKTWIEFRCSYLLSGYSLAKLGEQLQRYKVQKMVGDLDYNKVRHSTTPLTAAEVGYCVNDIRVVMAYIQEKIENEGGITNIPLTKTGYVRKYCRKNCLYVKHTESGKRVANFAYTDLMHDLQIRDITEFDTLQRAFSGGFTHANSGHVGEILENVASYDFTSSYPAVMVAEQYPMSAAMVVQPRTQQEFEYYINNYCCIFDIRFINIVSCIACDTPISVSKCFQTKNVVENNGRLFSASEITTTITNIDYKVYRAFYTWERCQVNKMYLYKRGYLPTEFVRTILELYKDKTELKGVIGKEIEYMSSKEMVNACYGMTVTNPLRDEFTYLTEWGCKTLTDNERAEQLFKYDVARNRFLFYPWGVFVTAYARRNLFTAIYTMRDDYIYSDTDSVKILRHEKYQDYFAKYNLDIIGKLERACEFHGLPLTMICPQTIKGVTKPLGVWDFEGVYLHFKTLGAKRYMVHAPNVLMVNGKSYDYSLTVSGLNKKCAIPYLISKYGDNIMEVFNDSLYIPPCGTGKNIHTYIDYPISGEITDYLGATASFYENSGVHLEPTDYTLSLSLLYLDFLRGRKLKKD